MRGLEGDACVGWLFAQGVRSAGAGRSAQL